MSIGQYRLISQVGAGPDGVTFRAFRAGESAEVRVLAVARGDALRWAELTRRLRLAALLDHPAALRVQELGLDGDPPFAALEWSGESSLEGRFPGAGPLSEPAAIALGQHLAGAIASAHRLGLAHGTLSPRSIVTADGAAWKIDFTGIRARPGLESDALAHAPFRAPEWDSGRAPGFAADVYSLGEILRLAIGGSPRDGLGRLLREMLAEDPADRPSASLARDRLSQMEFPCEVFGAPDSAAETILPDDAECSDFDLSVAPPAPDDLSPREGRGRLRLLNELAGANATLAADVGEPAPERLGRFRMLERIGRGGMGSVYRAEDLSDGSIVAVKVLNPAWARQPESLQRFRKEARLLAEVNNPYVTNLLEFNEDEGVAFLVLEFVKGESLARLLKERGPLEEPAATAILSDVARALVEAHERGIVHRDVKPENILLVHPSGGAAFGSEERGTPNPSASQRPTRVLPGVKLSDFGLARHVLESESMKLTQPGKVLGTPYYMSPEQCSGGPTGPGSDVYAMGATLFHLLAGRPPFLADDVIGLLAMHRYDTPPSLRELNPRLSEGICLLVEKALAKAPEGRYPDAGALLADLERLARGEPISVAAHPTLPDGDPARVLEYAFRWELAATPRQLWPFVSDTERLNRAVGLPPVRFATREVPGGGVRRFGTVRKLGLTATWEEHPFEWVEARRLGVLREYSRGPIRWLVSVVSLDPRPDGGTTLRHHVRLLPRGLWGRAVAAVEVGFRGRRGLDRVYRRIDAMLAGGPPGRNLPDAFEETRPLSGERRRRLDRLVGTLADRGVDPAAAERLGDLLANAPAQELARLRPLALAARWGLDPQGVVDACLHGAREGLLVLSWDLICPACRISSEGKDSLRSLREHGHCEACRIDYALDFASSVEMIFRSHPEIREPELATYCVGGPAHSPHVVAQARVAPGERIELGLSLAAGTYRVRSPQLPGALEFRVEPSATQGRWEVDFAGHAQSLPRRLKPGAQALTFANPHEREIILRVERTASRDDALTAARASSLAPFRDLFPGEILTPGQLINITNVTILVTELDRSRDLYESLGDARAFGVIHEHLRLLDDAIRREGGALIKTLGDGVLAAFDDPTAAVRVGLELPRLLAGGTTTRWLKLRTGVHLGPAMAATLNDHLDYFGTTVLQAAHLLRIARGGELILGQEVAAEPRVSALLVARGLEGDLLHVDLPGRPDGLVHRFAIGAGGKD